MPTLDDMNHPAYVPLLRLTSNLLGLCALCSHAKCRRARTCRGKPHECLSRYEPLVPDQALKGCDALVDGKLSNKSFDQLRAEEPAIHDLAAWRERLATTWR